MQAETGARDYEKEKRVAAISSTPTNNNEKEEQMSIPTTREPNHNKVEQSLFLALESAPAPSMTGVR